MPFEENLQDKKIVKHKKKMFISLKQELIDF